MTTTHHDIRVLVVADDHLARAGLVALLAERPGCVVVGQLDATEFASVSPDLHHADAVAWDLGWDAAASIEMLAGLDDSGPPVVALTADDGDATDATDAWTAGARAILPRDAAPATLASALLAASHGLAVFDPAQMALPVQPGAAQPQTEITLREVQVLHLIAEGLPNKTVARRLNISEHTVQFHVNSLLGKLGAHSRTEAVTPATRMGLIAL